MFKPLSLFIGFRYTRTKGKNHFISFVSLISMLGISVGVLSLIVSLSVMNGATAMAIEQTLKSVSHAVVYSEQGLGDWRELAVELARDPEIIGVAPLLETEALMTTEGENTQVQIKAIDPLMELNVTGLDGNSFFRVLSELAASQNGIILERRLAGSLNLSLGQDVTIRPIANFINGKVQDTRKFRFIGTANLDAYASGNTALIKLSDMDDLLSGHTIAQTMKLQMRVSDPFSARLIAEAAVAGLSQTVLNKSIQVRSWEQTQGSLFASLRMEKILTGLMLMMIVVIGAVNIVSTLVMVVADKGADIAILRTMGASKNTIMAIFIVQGSVVGLVGTALGAVLGVLIATNLSTITSSLEIFEAIYVISLFPSQLSWVDVTVIVCSALTVSVLATLYPAWRASKVQPAEVLRYE